jgi:hypothetical protein
MDHRRMGEISVDPERDFPHQVMLSCVGHPNEDFRLYCFERWPPILITSTYYDQAVTVTLLLDPGETSGI